MIRAEAIYKGATRPAMKFGVPLVPLVTVLGTGMLITMWGGAFLTWWTAVVVVAAGAPALAWMRFTTRKDDQRFRQLFIAARLALHDHNRRFWHARSYALAVYRGASDAWHA